MVVINEKLEAIARIRMAIDNDTRARQIAPENEADEVATDSEPDHQYNAILLNAT